MFANSMFNTGTMAALVTIPLFLLVGEILSRGSAIEVMLSSVDTIIGKIRGRQYVLTIVLATIFGALSGTATGVAAMLAPTDIQPSDSETKSTGVVGAFIRVLPVGIVILSIRGLIVLAIVLFACVPSIVTTLPRALL